MRLATAFALLLAALLPVDSRAALISMSIGGVWGSNAGGTTGGLTPGTSFTASVTFDDSAPDIDPTSEGIYLLSDDFDFVLWTGPYTFTNAAGGIAQVVDGGSLDGIAWGAHGLSEPSLPVLGTESRASFQLLDFTGTLLDSDLLTEIPWNLSEWTGGTAHLDVYWGTEGGFIFADGTITSLSVSSVPEPTTASLVAVGASVLAFARARRRI